MEKLVIKRNKKPETVLLSEDEELLRVNEEEKHFGEKQTKAYIVNRNEERGSIETQLEYIVENGVEAFIARDQAIRVKHPKKKAKV